MKAFFRFLAASWAVLVTAAIGSACPMCKSDIGVQVRAGIFDDNFGKHAILTLIPSRSSSGS